MPDSSEYDVRELTDLVLPYDVTTKELANASPRIVDGLNMYVTLGGKLSLAPGLSDVGADVLPGRCDRLVLYETIETPPKIFVLASVDIAGSWGVYYMRLDASSAWTSLGTLRDQNISRRPHEMSVAGGRVYIKAFPDSSSDKYGSIIFDGSGSTPHVYPWGLPSPTLAARINATSWSASTNPMTVYLGWQYVYCWVSITGQYSNRSPLESDPSATSNTGPRTNVKPQVYPYGHADTTNIPYIAIFRTTDGGGTFYFLDQIANTGAGYIAYEDNRRVPTTTDDPKTDMQLDTSNIAPSLTTNTVPPPVGPKHVIGTDTVEVSSKIAYYARRFWYGIGTRLYFSGQEEILNGVPEESWPSPNGFRGNYFILRGQIRMLQETNSGLYVITSNEILRVTGQDLTNFNINQIVSDTAGAAGHPHAITTYRDTVVFLSSDLQVVSVSTAQYPQVLSVPLGSSIRDLLTSNTEVIMDTFSRDGNAWLVVAVVNRSSPSGTKFFVYDTVRGIWFTPWGKHVSCFSFGRLRENDARNHLVCTTWDLATARLCVLDFDAFSNLDQAYAPTFTTNLFMVPSGNHINALRQPAHHPMLSFLMTERTKFTGDIDPVLQYRLDEFSGTIYTGTPKDPPFIKQRDSYNVKWYPVQQVVQRAQIKISKAYVTEKFEIQTLGFVFQSEAGS